MDHSANILDPISDSLPEKVWEHPADPKPKLKSQHRSWIERKIKTVLKDGGYHDADDWLSLVLTGSLTTYQYGKESDCDISLFVDINHFPDWSRAEMIGLMIEHCDGTLLPGTPYPLQCFVVPPDISKKDLYKPDLRSGYDIQADEWIVPPDKTRTHDVEREMNAYYIYALEAADKMERLLRYEPDKAELYWNQIHKRRQRDQKAGKGDYSEANIIYKFLAQRGLFPAISELTGDYIAKTAETEPINVLIHKFRANSRHPKLPQGRSFPWIYAPETNTLHLGPADAYHWDMIQHSPELYAQYGEKANQGPVDEHLHGRMTHPDKIMTYSTPTSPETKQMLADRVGGTPEVLPEGGFSFA